ncbi:MAG: hypothetical protein ACK5MG_03695 [Bacteroidales bacterium]
MKSNQLQKRETERTKEMHTVHKTKNYQKPAIETINIEAESPILAGSGNNYKPGGGWGN